jgi:cell division protease FtsH
MVMDYGMSHMGKVNFRESRRGAFLAGGDDMPRERTHSEQTSREIDQEIARIIDDSLAKVSGILETRRKSLVALAERLIEKEVIDTDELREVIEANSPSVILVPGTADTSNRRPSENSSPKTDLKAAENG